MQLSPCLSGKNKSSKAKNKWEPEGVRTMKGEK